MKKGKHSRAILERGLIERIILFYKQKTKEEKMAEKSCKGDHSGHICVLASNGKFEEIKAITKNPQFICFNCGRVADCDANLCNPMPLD
jgi:hypothetical protein